MANAKAPKNTDRFSPPHGTRLLMVRCCSCCFCCLCCVVLVSTRYSCDTFRSRVTGEPPPRPSPPQTTTFVVGHVSRGSSAKHDTVLRRFVRESFAQVAGPSRCHQPEMAVFVPMKCHRTLSQLLLVPEHFSDVDFNPPALFAASFCSRG